MLKPRYLAVVFEVATLLLFLENVNGDEVVQTPFDLLNPIVFQSGSRRGHFGWSSGLVNIQGVQGRPTSWIFIGDPKANATRDPTYVTRNVDEPGVVWRCSLFSYENLGNGLGVPYCETLNIDPIRDCGNRCPPGAPHYEYHNRNWVGGNIVTSDNCLVISAHHWHRGGDKDPVVNGLAYWFDPQRMFTGTNQLNIDDSMSHRLIPFFYPATGTDSLPFQFYSQEYDTTLLPNLAHGQAGVSLHLTNEGQLLMGAPGVQVWRGAIVRYQDSTRDRFDARRKNAFGKSQFNGYRIGKRSKDKAYANEYFGYAVTSGVFFRRQFDHADVFSFAAGSPRGRRLLGYVVIFKMSRTEMEGIQEEAVLIGDQFGSYFGSVLTSVDLNNDGLDELLIGAPSYDEVTTVAGAQKFVDHGTVFLYSATLPGVITAGFVVQSQNLIRITSGIGNKRGGRFGSAMVKLGDINEDGFQDFAIGAPYEVEDVGAVYIYYGKQSLETEWKPIVRVVSSTVSLNVKGFGCSFSTPLDVDHNYTPDLAVGAYKSQSLVLLRTRPVLDFETSVTYYAGGTNSRGTSDTNSRQPIQQLPANERAFQVLTCVKLKGKALAEAQTKLRLDVTFEMDVGQREPRFSFVGDQRGNRVTFQLEADALQFDCRTLQATAYVALNEKSASIEPIAFQQLIKYTGKSNKDNSVVEYVIESTSGRARILGGRDVFEPLAPFSWEKRIIPQELNINSACKNSSHCVPDLGIDAWWADDSVPGNSQKISEVSLNWAKRLGIHVKLTNRGEPAYSAEVTFTFKSQTVPAKQGIDFQSAAADCQFHSDREAKMRKDTTVIFTCTLNKPLRADEPMELPIAVSLVGIYAKAEQDEFIVGVSVQARHDPDSKRHVPNDLVLTLNANDVGVKLIGSVTPPEQSVSVHSNFFQLYEVILTGTSPVGNLYFNFKIPQKRGSPTLLRVKAPTSRAIQCVGNFAQFSRHEIPAPGDGEGGPKLESRRRRREVENFKSRLPIVDRLLPNSNMSLLGCGNLGDHVPSEDCMDVTCNMYNVHPNVPIELIRFDMVLNASQTAGVLGDKRILLVETLGSVEMFKEHSGKSFAQTIIHFNDVSISEKSTWVYIGSGIGALLLLILIMFGLYKTGFFKRAVKQELDERKAEVAEQEATRRASMMENPNHEEPQVQPEPLEN